MLRAEALHDPVEVALVVEDRQGPRPIGRGCRGRNHSTADHGHHGGRNDDEADTHPLYYAKS
jgi:hypothetical protein